MTPQEKDLVTQLLQRLKQAGGAAKDPEAETLIRQAMAEQPDAPYYLVQTVLMQDMALAEAQRRIADFERQAQPSSAPQRSFLGGTAPSAGPWARAPQQAPQPVPSSGWTSSPVMPQAGGSGFLRSAATTAMGIAGGALLFQGLSSLFGHGFGGMAQPGLGESTGAWSPAPRGEEQTAFDQPAAEEPAPADADQDVAADDWDSGDDSDLV
jgi:uncharacterized protein